MVKQIVCLFLVLNITAASLPVVYAKNGTNEITSELPDSLYIDDSIKNKVSEIANVEIKELDEPLVVEFEIEQTNDIKLLSDDDKKSFFDYGSDWGYKDLDIRSNPEGRKTFYNELLRINKAFASSSQDVPKVMTSNKGYEDYTGYEDYIIGEIQCDGLDLTYQEAEETYISFRADHPEYYWVPFTLLYFEPSNTYYILIFEDYASGSVRSGLTAAIQNEFNKYMEAIDSYTTVFEKSLIIYDKIIESVEYGYDKYGDPLDNSYSYAHNIVGVLDGSDETSPVCESYAKAYQLLLTAAGVENVYVEGEVWGGNHAWNYIRTEDEKWHPADATWDDNGESSEHWNFLSEVDTTVEFYGYSWGRGGHVPLNLPDWEYLYGNRFFYKVPTLEKERYAFKQKPHNLINQLEYKRLSGGTIEITKANVPYGIIEIPERINGLTVSSIGDGAFEDANLIYTLTIPGTVNSIGNNCFVAGIESVLSSVKILGAIKNFGEYVFSGQTNITSFTMAEGTTQLGYAAFRGCEALRELTIPDSVLVIQPYCFDGCVSLSDIHLPAKLQRIWFNAFEMCSSLESITIPNSVLRLDSGVFKDCINLKQINIPASVRYISDSSDNLFSGCRNLQSITVDSFNPYYKAIDNVLYSSDMSEIIFCSNRTGFEIPDSVTSMATGVFSGCPDLESVILPEFLEIIPGGTLKDCAKLTEVSIPENVISIGREAFSGCTGLKTIEIPASVYSMESGAFSGCTGLEEVILPDYVAYPDYYNDFPDPYASINLDNYIGSHIFFGCTSLKSIVLPRNVKRIDMYAFADCISLETIDVPDSIREIGWHAFLGCESLKKINIPDGVTNIRYGTFAWCRSLSELELPESITAIEKEAFADCDSLVSIKIPSKVTEIQEQTFWGCGNLEECILPPGLKHIGVSAFEFCSSLKQIDIPYGTKSIGYNAFHLCKSLQKAKIPATVEEIPYYSFAEESYYGLMHEGLTIYGYSGSEAETYANESDIDFFAIDENPPVINSTEINQGEDGYIFSVDISGIAMGSTLFVALYSDGLLSGVHLINPENDNFNDLVRISASSADTAKVFIWDGLYPLVVESYEI